MNSERLITQIYDALYRMGFRANHTGFFYLSYPVFLCVQEGSGWFSAAQLPVKVARHYRTSPETVTTQLHAAASKVWNTDRYRMEAMMGRCLKSRPSDTEILAYLYRYITGQTLEERD